MPRLLVFLLIPLLAACTPRAEPEPLPAPAVTPCTGAVQLSDAPFDGRPAAFVWYDPAAGTAACHGPADLRRVPASTFKIPHTLIALDTRVLDGPEAELTWDPEKYPHEPWWPAEWGRDHTLASALEYSVVWYYREVAEMVGPERERDYLQNFDLGNAEVGDNPTSFWLVGPLAISAEEQVRFLQRLWTGDLPASPVARRQTRALVTEFSDAGGERILGKTGTQPSPDRTLNWLVGVVERDEGPAYFAFWIETERWMPPANRLEVLRRARDELVERGP
jgi:beta-lactamase class D